MCVGGEEEVKFLQRDIGLRSKRERTGWGGGEILRFLLEGRREEGRLVGRQEILIRIMDGGSLNMSGERLLTSGFSVYFAPFHFGV